VAQRLHAQPLPLSWVPPGAFLLRQGDPCPHAWIVETGVMMERLVARDGRVLIPRLPGPGELVGGVDADPSPVSVLALRRTALRPAVGDELETGLAARYRETLAFGAELAWLDTAATIERRLRHLAERVGRPAPGGVAIGITLTQEDLGAFAGATRESANRAVGILLRRGTIARLARGRYLVREPLRPVG
jgi:CRP-like cAMP-binding protein